MTTNNKRYLRYYSHNKGHFLIYPVPFIHHEEFVELLYFVKEQPIIKETEWAQFKSQIIGADNQDIKYLFSLLFSYLPTRPRDISWLDVPDFFLFLDEIWDLHQIVSPPTIEDDDFLEIPSSGSPHDDLLASLIKSFGVDGTFALAHQLNYQSMINVHWRYCYLGRDPDKIRAEMSKRNAMKIFSDSKELAAWSAALGF